MTEFPALPPIPEGAPDLVEDFSAAALNPRLWVEHYLPHWTTPDRSAARYDLDGDGLLLRIDSDQLDWRPEDAPLRVSNLQTGNFCGPLGSAVGMHRHRPDDLLVRTETPTSLLWAPSAGRLDVTVSASTSPGCMLAVWLVGAEHRDPVTAVRSACSRSTATPSARRPRRGWASRPTTIPACAPP